MTRSYLLLLTILSLTGCVPDEISTPPVDVTLKAAGNIARPNHISSLKVRVYENVGVNRVWIEERTGVSCQISSPFYSVKASTPARIKVPTYGTQTPNFTTTCTYKGETLETSSGGCFFERGKEPDPNAEEPRGVCNHADITVIFGK